MGVSFKVSKTGTRFKPKPLLQSETCIDDPLENLNSSSRARKLEGDVIEGGKDVAARSSMSNEGLHIPADHEVSFTLNLYPDGYSIVKPSENEAAHQGTPQDVPKLLHPYDRASETLFSAIESGRLPGDLLVDIPCKYVDGTLVCEVRDYRKYASEQGSTVPSMEGSPIVNKLCLKMSLENVVKDIPLISDNSWTYGDLMEVESRILKALQPQLCLDPTPKLDRLSNNPLPMKLNLGLSSLRRKRLRQMPEITVTSSNKIHGKKVCIDRVPESSNRLGDSEITSGNVIPQHVGNLTAQNLGPSNMLALRPKSFVPDASVPPVPLVSHQSRYPMGVGNPRSMQNHGSGSVVTSGASPNGQDMTISYTDNVNSNASLHGKRESQDGQLSPLSSINKRARMTPMGPDGIQQQQIGPNIAGLHGSDMNWKNTSLQQQAIARGIQYTGIQKYPQQMFEGVLNQEAGAMPFAAGQQSMRYGAKEEQFETDKLDGSELVRGKNDMQMLETETSHLDQQSRLEQRLSQQPFMRSSYSQTSWSQHIDNNLRKEDQLQERKSVQSPRLSSGALAHSPLSSKSGEFSSGSVGAHFGGVATTSAIGASQKEKAAVTSVPAVGGTQSLTSSANDSMQRQHQVQAAAKRRTNSLPKTPAMSGVGSPVSVSNMSVQLNANSPSVGTPPLADQTILDRFAKIDLVTMRYQLNCKKNKVDDYPIRKPCTYSPQKLLGCLNTVSNHEEFKDDACTRPLSKSLVGGSMNVCKARILNFVLAERILQGNHVSYVPKFQTRMIMSEKPNDGTVAMHYGDIDDGDVLAAEDYLPTLPNTHLADLLAAQFCSLMIREGYHVEDHVQPKPTRMSIPSSSQLNAAGLLPNTSAVEMQQYAEAVSGQASSEVAKPTNSGNASQNSSQNLLANTRILSPGNPQSLQMSQGLLSGVSIPMRPQQIEPQPSLQQQQQPQQPQQNQHSLIQQQHPQFQRSPMMLANNPLSHLNAIGQNSNMQLGNHMVNKPSPLQLQMLQQHQQQQQQQHQQQQPQLQRKMMMGLGTAVGMGNMGNNMVGLGGLGNAMNMGGARGIGGTGISAPMASISGMGNMGQSAMNFQALNISNQLSQQLRSGAITPAQAQAALFASKPRMAPSRGMLGGPQSGIAGMSGARQMHPSSAGLSMLGQTLNRANINQMQRTALNTMGPPKLMVGVNPYMNQQQQQHQQQLQLQQQQQQMQQQQQLQPQQQQLQQQQQQLQPQQETTSPLQAVVSPPQVGSPSTMGISQLGQQPQQQQLQQQASPQQMSQRTPMSPQMSSGAIHAMSTGNPEACPASPQLSSQTLGSVGSITNSPMELQGVNKSNTVSNA